MRTKNVLIIVIIILAIVGIGLASYMLLPQEEEYKNISMDGITFEVKNSTANVTNTTANYYIYNDTENNITVLLFDSEGMGLDDFDEATQFAAVRDAMQMDNKEQNSNNTTYNYSQTVNRYTYLTNYTHKNLFIITQDKGDMEHIINTIKIDTNVANNTTENQTNNTTSSTSSSSNSKKSSSTTQKSSTEREEDKITPDGWNPKEHETSREDMGDGYEKVHYDDGYFRVVDKKGNIQTYGYG
ncbi:MAG: hypothetical protein BZ137_00830 [Methanosphaera sp. rholeuAM130]|nr:MAG: hypothetical protein BZ137_00830 [Methanosphaera sp. rholeuAM130]